MIGQLKKEEEQTIISYLLCSSKVLKYGHFSNPKNFFSTNPKFSIEAWHLEWLVH
jgi:hypothetical protein